MRISTLPFLVGLAAIFTVVACGERKVAGDPVIHSFEVTPALLPPGGGEVELSWDVEGAEGVTLEPGGRVLAATGSLRLPVVDDTTFTLIAHGASRSVQQARSVLVERVVITGRVVDEFLAPAPGIEVFVNGTRVGTSDAAGHFSAEQVKVPYTVRLRDPDPQRARRGRIYDQVTVRDGTYVLGQDFRAPNPTFSPFRLKLSWTGGISTTPAGFAGEMRIYVVSETGVDVPIFPPGSLEADSIEFDIDLKGGPDQSVDVVLLQYYFQDGPTSHTENYVRAARIEGVTLSANAAVNDLGSAQLVPIATRNVPLRYETGDWLQEVNSTVSIHLPNRRAIELFPQGEYGREVTLFVPEIPFGQIFVDGFGLGPVIGGFGNRGASQFGWTQVPPQATQMSVTLPDPPILLSPEEGGRASPDYAIHWSSAVPLCVLYFSDQLGSADVYEIVTARQALDGAWREQAGLEPSAGEQYLSLDCYGGFNSIDEVLGAPERFRGTLERAALPLFTSSATVSFDAY